MLYNEDNGIKNGTLSDQVREECNSLLFNRKSTIICLQEKLEANYNTNLNAISSLIDANYETLETRRTIFEGIEEGMERTGK